MELIFSTGHYRNRVSKSARILCNSVTNPPRLTFTAHPVQYPDSLKLYTLTPSLLDLDANRPEDQAKPWEYDIAVKNVSQGKFRLNLVSAPEEVGIRVDMPRGDIKPGKEKTIKVKIDPGIADQLFTKCFTVEASDSAKTRYTVPIDKKMRWGPAPTTSSR